MIGDSPTVSIVIPTYNREDTLPRAIQSVLNQTYDDFELIVVDDNSTDSTSEVVAGFDSSKIHYKAHRTNKGAAAARNTGVREAKGRYIAFLDSDDEWFPDKLRKQMECILENEGEVVYCDVEIIQNGEPHIWGCPGNTGDIYRAQLVQDQVPRTSAVLMSREAFRSVGGFNTDLPARQDYELWLRLAENHQFEYVPEALVKAFVSRDDRISADISAQIDAHDILIELLRSHVSKEPWYFRRRVFSSHNSMMGRYLYTRQEYKLAMDYLRKALQQNPLNLTAAGLYLLTVFKIPPDGRFIRLAKRLFSI